MNERLSGRFQHVAVIGQDVVKLLLEEPIKEAVREALLEEEIREQANPPNASQPQDDDGRTIPVKSVLLAVSLVGGILLLRRIRSDGSNRDIPGGSTGQGETGAAESRSQSHVSE